MLVRLFLSAIDPGDLADLRRVFVEDIRPSLERQPGCRGVELVAGMEKNAGGLLEGAAMSRWDTRENLERALGTREVQESIIRVRQWLRQEPVTRTYEVLE